jgi:hypothetical protein
MARAKAKQTSKKPTPKEKTHLTTHQIVEYQIRLDLIHDVMATVVAALEGESQGTDFANTLRRHGMDATFKIVEELDQINHHFGHENEP